MRIYAAIYWLLIRLYALAIKIASLFNPKAKLFIKGRQDLLPGMQDALRQESRPRVWMHCASLGEFEQGRPVLERLKKGYPDFALVLTFFSPSGYEVRKNYEGADYVFYLPLDSHANAKRFLDIVHPSLCIFVKYEFWYFYLLQIKKQGIPAILISAFFMKDQAFFSWYGTLQRYMLSCFAHIFVQNEASGVLLKKIGINDVSINGDTRFDRVIEIAQEKTTLPIADAFVKGHRILVAGSTWKEDDFFLQQTLSLLPDYFKLIIVPHEVDVQHIAEIEKLFPGLTIRWSEWKNDNTKRVLIVDSVGLLSHLYRYAYIAWIGGAFGKAGVHNVLEAAVYGKPCAYGPIFHQFNEARELLEAGGAISTDKPEVFAEMLRWEGDSEAYKLASTDAGKYVYSKAGATNSIMEYLRSEKILGM